MNDAERLIRELKNLNVYNLVELPVIKLDSYGQMKGVRQGLSRENGFLENNLAVLEKTVIAIRKACNFHLLVRGD